MAGYFSADRQLVLGNEKGDTKMAERKGYHNAEPKEEMKGAKEGQLRTDKKKDGKKSGRHHSRHSSRK